MPNFLFATDSFKGTLSSLEAARLLERSARASFPGCGCASVEVADGGEGTVRAVLGAAGGVEVAVPVKGPTGSEVEATYAILPSGAAVIEVAAACGLPLVGEDCREPLLESSYGVGQLVNDALGRGCRELWIGLGGSATNDGGMGMLSALGVRFLDEKGVQLAGIGADLARVARVDTSGINPAIGEAEVHLMSDVDAPLTGPCGATRVFGPQKGAGPEALDELEAGMRNYARRVAEALGTDRSEDAGAGAAGGLGFACLAFLHGSLRPGIECVLELAGFDRLLETADLVVTGEGHADAQTAGGKVMSGIASHARRAGVPVVALVGGHDLDFDAGSLGIETVMPTVSDVMTFDEVKRVAREQYALAADRLFKLLALGVTLA